PWSLPPLPVCTKILPYPTVFFKKPTNLPAPFCAERKKVFPVKNHSCIFPNVVYIWRKISYFSSRSRNFWRDSQKTQQPSTLNLDSASTSLRRESFHAQRPSHEGGGPGAPQIPVLRRRIYR